MNDTSPNVKLVKRNELPRAIKKDIENSKKIMTPEEIDQLYVKIHKYAHTDEKTRQSHVENIQMRRT